MDTKYLTAIPKKNNHQSRYSGFRYYSGNTLIGKTCGSCGIAKYIEEFNNATKSLDGKVFQCRDCAKESRKKSEESRIARDPDYLKNKYKKARDSRRARDYDQLVKIREDKYPEKTKPCKTCKNSYPFSKFYRNMLRYDGLSAECKKCSSKKSSARQRKPFEEYWLDRGIPLECYACGGPYQDIDHVIAESSGGPDILENILPMCFDCNRGVGGKFDKPIIEWLPTKFNDDQVVEILARIKSYGVAITL